MLSPETIFTAVIVLLTIVGGIIVYAVAILQGINP